MWRLTILSLCVVGALADSCTLRFRPSEPGVFTRKFGSNNIILSAESGEIIFDSTMNIKSYCASGFKDYSVSEKTAFKELTFTCTNNIIYYTRPNNGGSAQLYNNGALACSTESMYYEAHNTTCASYSVVYGFFVEKQPVILADVCYDLNTMQTEYVHYVAGPRTAVVEAQSAFNPENITISSDQSVVFGLDSTAINSGNQSLKTAVQLAIPGYADVVQYQLDGLTPVKSAIGVLDPYTNGLSSTNLVAWWRSLKFGNWRHVERAINDISVNIQYDVYAGVSRSVMYPVDGKCSINSQLRYKIGQYVRDVPLYIWNYIKKRNDPKDAGVVIIGVNSPFFAGANSTAVLCKDVCDSIQWLENLNRVREMSAFGYVFCCHPADVQGKLENFPRL